jgi:hypothetical protein
MAPSDFEMAKNLLHEIAVHAHNLAMGLQNAAPPQALEHGPIKSVQYLMETAIQLEKTSQAITALMTENQNSH